MTTRAAQAPQTIAQTEIEELVGIQIENAEAFEGVDSVTTLDVAQHKAVVFRDTINEETAAAIDAFPGSGALFILPAEARGMVTRTALFTASPRIAFSTLIAAMFDYHGAYWTGYEDGTAAQSRCPKARLMPGSLIHPTARIGSGSLVFPGVVIGPNVRIGLRALIKSNSVIGLPGFGIHRDERGHNLHLPHIGGVEIADDVEIGALNTICAGTIHPTVIGDRVKIDDHVHVAHNCEIGRDSQLTAHVELSGSTRVGERCILGPNCSVANGTQIGPNAIVGIAANVTKDVEGGYVVAGNPARAIRTVAPAEIA